MFTPATLSIVVTMVALGLWGIGLGVLRRRPDRPFLLAVLIVEAELVLHALVAIAFVIAGHRPEPLAEWLGYVLVTVMTLPFAWNRARSPYATPVDAVVTGIVCVVTAVAVMRLLVLW